ncbi:MAG TPA: zinc ribbon domain-containing protein [Lacipirellulaceae bacterium]|nr:zinc ribbon domain-containing protein [Lacipirellulaceae bacterium]
MPLYEYACEDCGHESELLMTGAAHPVCPECGSQQMSKLLSIVSAPGRNTFGAEKRDLPPGPCGSHCGCFPQG